MGNPRKFDEQATPTRRTGPLRASPGATSGSSVLWGSLTLTSDESPPQAAGPLSAKLVDPSIGAETKKRRGQGPRRDNQASQADS